LSAVVLGDLTKMDVDFLAVSSSLATPTLIRSAHKAGREVYVWTVNDPLGMSTFLSRGVDGLITDEPALAREVMAERAELSSAERLLVELAVLFGRNPEIEMREADA
jgi:glycerophosphoryl diester phosphodiesterase